ncbi:uncharacterized protein LOC119688686 [Teleopsis dalmanni]|uniref:uncharacterized protein LOC119688686 n=1 Tax=Teleopsis dalmanni TaxID=139649 RepID=UPI0018CF7F28|nr:uncharacterized protein LOC119688686 [Teleopsis dalmanni]
MSTVSNKSSKRPLLKNISSSIGGLWHTFFTNNAIHGITYLVKEQLTSIEKILWFILIIVSIFFTVVLSLQSIDRFNRKSTVISLERDSYNFITSMPGATICPIKRLDKGLYDAYYNTFKDKSELSIIDTKIRGSAGSNIIYTRQVLTEYGLCYITNTYLEPKYSSYYFFYGKPFETNYKDLKLIKVIKGGYFSEDMSYTFKGFFNTPIEPYIHSPHEVMQVDKSLGTTEEACNHFMETLEIITEEDFDTGTTINQRQCRFQHETNLTHFPIYTKNLCVQECRLNLVYKICGCIPHFYPNRIANPKAVCSYKQLKECLSMHEEWFIKLDNKDTDSSNVTVKQDPCYCLPNCLDAIVMSDSGSILGGNSIIVSLFQRPQMRLKRQLIFTFTNLLGKT